jgi:hypothetical protein
MAAAGPAPRAAKSEGNKPAATGDPPKAAKQGRKSVALSKAAAAAAAADSDEEDLKSAEHGLDAPAAAAGKKGRKSSAAVAQKPGRKSIAKPKSGAAAAAKATLEAHADKDQEEEAAAPAAPLTVAVAGRGTKGSNSRKSAKQIPADHEDAEEYIDDEDLAEEAEQKQQQKGRRGGGAKSAGKQGTEEAKKKGIIDEGAGAGEDGPSQPATKQAKGKGEGAKGPVENKKRKAGALSEPLVGEQVEEGGSQGQGNGKKVALSGPAAVNGSNKRSRKSTAASRADAAAEAPQDELAVPAGSTKSSGSGGLPGSQEHKASRGRRKGSVAAADPALGEGNPPAVGSQNTMSGRGEGHTCGEIEEVGPLGDGGSEDEDGQDLSQQELQQLLLPTQGSQAAARVLALGSQGDGPGQGAAKGVSRKQPPAAAASVGVAGLGRRPAAGRGPPAAEAAAPGGEAVNAGIGAGAWEQGLVLPKEVAAAAAAAAAVAVTGPAAAALAGVGNQEFSKLQVRHDGSISKSAF